MEHNRKRVRLWLWIGAAVLWTLFIWSNSLKVGTDSADQSARVMLLLRPLLDFAGVPPELHHFLVRKAAHFTEFAVLAVIWWKAFLITEHQKTGRRELMALLVSVATAAADETLQRFSEGRACSLKDVGIDSLGAVCGIGLCVLLCRLWKRKDRSK